MTTSTQVAVGQESIENLEASIVRFRRWLQLAVAVAIGAYLTWFALIHRLPVSQDAAAWGQFGDFLGGFLNPLIAYAAFHLVTKSVLIQGRELAETREALRAAATAQADQARHAQASLRISALRTIIDAATSNIDFVRTELEFVAKQVADHGAEYASFTIDGTRISGSEVMEHLAKKGQFLKQLGDARDDLLRQMRKEIGKNGDA